MNDQDEILVNASDLNVFAYLQNLTDLNSGLVVLNYDDDTANRTGYFKDLITSFGEVNSANFRILSSGDFKVVVEASGDLDLDISSDDTESFYITNKIKDITLSLSPSTPLIYEDFTLSVSLTGEDDNKYLGDSTIDIQGQSNISFTDSSISYSSSTSNTFTAFSNETGTSDLQVSVTNGTATDLSETLSLTVVNSKLKIKISPTVKFT